MRIRPLLSALLLAAPSLAAQSEGRAPGQHAAVERAALDYLEGFYEGDTLKHQRSVSPQVLKFGYYRRPDGTFARSEMPWPAFAQFAAGVRAGRNLPPAGAPKRVEVYDVQTQIAAVRVDAWWGMDYLLLAQIDGRWMVTQVLWQGPPAATSPSTLAPPTSH